MDVPTPHPTPHGDTASKKIPQTTFSHKSYKSALGLRGSALFFHMEMKRLCLASPLIPAPWSCLQRSSCWDLAGSDAVSTAPRSEAAASSWQLCLGRFPQEKHM